MTIRYKGNFVSIHYEANETPELIQLPDGYSFDTISVLRSNNINAIYDEIGFNGFPMTFPPINSKSPCILHPVKVDNTKSADIRILIIKFGQIPDSHYFDPILVTGDDGNTYPVIPSDQFK